MNFEKLEKITKTTKVCGIMLYGLDTLCDKLKSHKYSQEELKKRNYQLKRTLLIFTSSLSFIYKFMRVVWKT